MGTLDRRFKELAKDQRPKYPPPFSLRLIFDERARLDLSRGSTRPGRYIRGQVLGDDAAPRKKRGRNPVKDHEAF